MKVWKLESNEKNFSFKLVNFDEDYMQLESATQGKILSNWLSIKMRIGIKGKKSDLPHFYPGVLVFSEKSIQILNSYIENSVQYLTIEGTNEYVLANVVNVLNDSVDHERSISYKDRHGRFAGYEKISFIEDKVKDQYLFKIKEHVKTRIYVTDLFRDIVLASKLKGYDFIEVWDSEVSEDMEQQRQDNYERKLADIEQNKGVEMSWSEAVNLANAGKSLASGKWKIQNDETGNMLLGQLTDNLSYVWIDPVFLPPILFGLKWHEVERSIIKDN